MVCGDRLNGVEERKLGRKGRFGSIRFPTPWKGNYENNQLERQHITY
jgi:hypothetical protein